MPAFLPACTVFLKSVLNCAYSCRSAIVITVLWPVMIWFTPFTLFAALASESPMATPLPPLLASSSGMFLPEKMSPACITPSAGNTTHASPLVWPRPK